MNSATTPVRVPMTSANFPGRPRFFPFGLLLRIVLAPFRFLFSRRGFFTLAVFATLIAVGYVVENIRGRRALEQCLSDLRARGIPTTFEELQPPPIPDEENVAMHPAMLAITEFPRSSAMARELERKGHTVRYHEGDSNSAITLNLKSFLSDAEAKQSCNGPGVINWTDLSAAVAWIEPRTPLASELPEEALRRTRLWASALQTLEEPLARPHCIWPTDPMPYGYRQIAMRSLFGETQSLSRAVSIRAAALIHLGNPDLALKEVLTLIRWARLLSEQRIFVGQLVHIACAGVLSNHQVLENILNLPGWRDEHYASICSELGKVDPSLCMLRGFQAELLLAFNTANKFKTFSYPEDAAHFVGLDAKEHPLVYLFVRLAPDGWADQNAVTYSRWMLDSHLLTYDSDRGLFKDPPAFLEDLVREVLPGTPYTLGAIRMAPAMSSILGDSRKLHMTQENLRLLCALKRYWLAHKAWPKSQSELAPRFTDRVPHDLYTGGEITISPAADGSLTLVHGAGRDGAVRTTVRVPRIRESAAAVRE